MNDQAVRQHVEQWIQNTLKKPSPHFNDLPPCPYSHSTLAKSKLDVRYESGALLLPTLASIAQTWDDSYEVMVVMCDKNAISPDELAQGATELSKRFESLDLLVNCDHPDCADPRFQVTSTNGKYAMGAVQRLSGFVDGARPLFKKGYYRSVDFADLSHYTSFRGNFSSGEEWFSTIPNVQFHDHHSKEDEVTSEILAGLRQYPKSLPAKINYYDEGAELYEEVCETPEYYLTRVELSIMERHIREIASCFTEDVVLIEPGSGNSKKTRLLFEHLPSLVGYIPIDIAKEQLLGTAAQIACAYPQLEVQPLYADYTQPFELPEISGEFSRKLVYYPGSTIGNQSPESAVSFLKSLRQLCGPDDALLIGVDLMKDPGQLELAYDDPAGANRRFILNPLNVLKRDFGVDFDVSNYQHHVVFIEEDSCVKICMKSLSDHELHLGEEKIEISKGELIERAVSYKYTRSEFQAMATQAGWKVQRVWTDEQQWFSVQYLTPADGEPAGRSSEDVYGELTPMVTAPLEYIQQRKETGDGNVLYLGENEGVKCYQTWKPSHARYVLQENEDNYVREPTGSRFAPLAIGPQQSHENLIIGVDGDEWQEKRKLLRGSFIRKYAENFLGLAAGCCADQLSSWESPSENVSYQSFNLMFSAILRYVLGVDANDADKRGVWQALPDVNRYFHNGLFTKKTIMDSAYDRSFGVCREFFQRAIDDRLARPSGDRRYLLTSIAQKYDLQDPTERDQMYTDILSVSLAGADAPSLALAWTLYAVARYPEVKARILGEVDEVLAAGKPSWQDFTKLRYTQAVVQETLRLYPPAWYTPRTNVEEDVLDGVRIPAGSTVIVFQYLMHRDPEFWEDADAFVPERFLGSKGHPAYMPYGWGPRYCFAADYANFMLVAFLAQILREFDLHLLTDEPPGMNPWVNLRMSSDLRLGTERRG